MNTRKIFGYSSIANAPNVVTLEESEIPYDLLGKIKNRSVSGNLEVSQELSCAFINKHRTNPMNIVDISINSDNEVAKSLSLTEMFYETAETKKTRLIHHHNIGSFFKSKDSLINQRAIQFYNYCYYQTLCYYEHLYQKFDYPNPKGELLRNHTMFVDSNTFTKQVPRMFPCRAVALNRFIIYKLGICSTTMPFEVYEALCSELYTKEIKDYDTPEFKERYEQWIGTEFAKVSNEDHYAESAR